MGARGKNFYNEIVGRAGFADAARTIQDHYLDGRKDEAAAAVPRELLDRLHLIGPAVTSANASAPSARLGSRR